MPKKAFLIVDVQKDFCPGGTLAVSEGDQVVGPINKMIDFARRWGWLTLVSRDWHPRKTKHFAEFGGIWPVHCVQDTVGAEFHPDLDFQEAIIISKAMNPNEGGYSPFDGTTSDGEPLEEFLRLHGVEELYIAGLATDYCVKAAAIDGIRKGFKVRLLLDACRGVNQEPTDVLEAVKTMFQAGVVITSTRVVQRENS